MNLFKAFLMVTSLLLMTAKSPKTTAGTQDCIRHELSENHIHQKIKHWSALKPFANWSIQSLRLDSCVVEGLVPVFLRMATPSKFSRYGLRYELSLVIKLDGASGLPDTSSTPGWRDLAAVVKKTIRTAEHVETVRRFIQRFSVAKAELSPRADHVTILYKSKQLQSSDGTKSAKLVFDPGTPAGISSFSLPHADSLPVLPHLLRMIEVVSSRFPSCQIGWVDGSLRHVADSNSERTGWNFSVLLRGDGCPASCIVTLAPDGDDSIVSASEAKADETSR